MRSPNDWEADAERRIKARWPDAFIKKRIHPEHPLVRSGQHPMPAPLDDDLAEAACVVVWHSTVAVTAIMRGIPVLYDAPAMAVGRSARRLGTTLRNHSTFFEAQRAFEPSSRGLFEAAWHQWDLEDIESGNALDMLLLATEEGCAADTVTGLDAT